LGVLVRNPKRSPKEKKRRVGIIILTHTNEDGRLAAVPRKNKCNIGPNRDWGGARGVGSEGGRKGDHSPISEEKTDRITDQRFTKKLQDYPDAKV